MIRLLWLGIALLSAFWLWALPGYAFMTSGWAYVLSAGLLLTILGCLRGKQVISLGWSLYLFSIPFLLGAILLPFPYNVPFILLSLGLASCLLQQRFPTTRAISLGMLVSGFSMLPQALVTPLYAIFASRYHEADLLTPFFYWMLKAVGIPAAMSQQTIYLPTPGEVLVVVTTWEKLGLYFCVVFFLAGLLLVTLATPGRRVRSAIKLALAILAYATVRHLLLTAIFLDTGNPDIFWKPIWAVISWLPLVPLLMRLVPLEWKALQMQSFVPQGKYIALGFLNLLLVFSLVGAFVFDDPGKPKQGRVLIDEFHSNWEWTTKKYDTSWYGIASGYNYYNLADYLNHFYNVESKSEQLTTELLSGYDVLICKMPTTPYSELEVEAIDQFVQKGGGLFLIGDHTNVFGSSTFLNPLTKRFGLRFNYDSTYDLITSDLSLYQPPELLPHPVVQRMPPFLFATSCTLDAPLFSESVIMGYNLKALDLDYSRPSFFPDHEKTKNYRFGLFLQAAAVRHGQGRVLAFTDSTVFSNFYMFIPGKPELALGIVDWLNREGPAYSRGIFLILAVLSLVSIGYLANRTRRDHLSYVLILTTLMGAVLATPTFGHLNRTLHPPPIPHTEFVKVAFESELSSSLLPATRVIRNPKADFQTFYVWTQRLGYVPSLSPTLAQALTQGDVVVIINPRKPFSPQQVDSITQHIELGGKVLLLEDAFVNPSGPESPANQILERFGMKVNYLVRRNSRINNDLHQSVGAINSSVSVEGGQPLLVYDDGAALFSIAERGHGMLAVMASSSSFNSLAMGTTGTVPNQYQRFLYQLEFWMLESMVKGQFSPFPGHTSKSP
ncbi:Gldg family protein [Chloroflexota bacterium]